MIQPLSENFNSFFPTVQVNGEIQSDAEAEQRQRLREEKRASAFAHQVASLEAQLTSVRKEKAASDSALKVKLEEALEELRVSERARAPLFRNEGLERRSWMPRTEF